MRRRRWLAGSLAWLAGAAACTTGRGGPRSITVPLERLQAVVDGHFPRRLSAQGLLQLSVQAPRLRLLPALDHLGARLELGASSPLLARAYTGEADLDFALRYEPSDRSLRATELHLNALQLAGLPAPAEQLLRQSLADALRQSLRELVLYRLREQDLLLADTLGLQPGAISVTPEGLRIALVAKGQAE
ncbi:DUF1439 domain-containing protein [Comamonas sp. NLF-1-9]|uniref:DUF1439 domain-containing protein n=1 Tax=Comamonas sp. NLF-1-9 TaxID=2853163 RepID=UPI001C468EDB|nr:DUF1439 domain-containing protein [Comamonas sp. NLF-1-9]QXL85907.1 DUF1439 domain-containing protein [Comamonas sp. NLF-1-9]